jgi:hypothetical protein
MISDESHEIGPKDKMAARVGSRVLFHFRAFSRFVVCRRLQLQRQLMQRHATDTKERERERESRIGSSAFDTLNLFLVALFILFVSHEFSFK